ncbi:MAG: glycosyltransferase family 39 protein [Chloroflexota bacterium]
MKSKYIPLLFALLVAAALKVLLIITQSVPFNGDEAIVSLMARHIIQGARPTFFYGQAYMGSLDAWLVAIGFQLFGEKIIAIRIVQSFLYLIFIVTVWVLTRKLYKDKLTANFAAMIATVPPILVTTYTTATLGGYGESLILGNFILLIGYGVTYGDKKDKWWAWLTMPTIYLFCRHMSHHNLLVK